VKPLVAEEVAPTPDPVVPPKKEPKPVKPKRPVKPVAKVKKPTVRPEPKPVAPAASQPATGPTEATASQAGGGSGASSGPPLPSGGGAGPGSFGSPLRAGELDNQPALVFAPKPEYPFQAKRRGLRALLRVRLLVDTVGRVERVDIVGGEHVDAFAETVRSTLSRWRFKPGTRKGTPVHWVAILPVSFELE
jgi:protein TonB